MLCSLTVISLISHEGEHLSPSASCHLLMETSQPLTQGQGHTGWWEGATLASSSPPSWGTARERVNSSAAPPPPRPGLIACAVTQDLELKGRAVSPPHRLDRCPGLSNSTHGVLELECFPRQVWAEAGAGKEVKVCLVLGSAGSLGRTLWFLGGHLLRALLGVLSKI